MNSPSVISQQYVALDSSTWIDLVRHRAKPESNDVVAALNSGRIIPYVTYDHVMELLQHDDQGTRIEQLEFFEELQLVAFPEHFPSPPWKNSPICASYLDVQEAEIWALLNDPNLGLEQVLEQAMPLAVAGLKSGRAIAYDSVLREIARSGRAARIVQQNRAAASMIHIFPQNPDEIMPRAGDYTMLSQQAAEQAKPRVVANLAQQFRLNGDPRIHNPDRLAAEITELAFQQIMPFYDASGEDPFREFTSTVLGIDLSRLPAAATANDWITETLYSQPNDHP